MKAKQPYTLHDDLLPFKHDRKLYHRHYMRKRRLKPGFERQDNRENQNANRRLARARA